jgi:major vault protein
MSEREREKREIALAPGSYAYMQDTTKGIIKVLMGPTVINQTGTEVPVLWNGHSGKFDLCPTLEGAVKQAPVAAEGSYIVLDNPAKDEKHPSEGVSTPPELLIGRKIVIPGPCTFALWPGQNAAVVEGHQLRSNEYLLVRVYNEEEARKNWTKAVVKTTGVSEAAPTRVPSDLSVGRLFIIQGTEVSFYIPPTGVMVVPEIEERTISFVRGALTLEKLEYCILVDEDGNKRYERGPQVVFPKPTETFRKDKSGDIKFRAVELNPIQGLHIKVISAYIDEANGLPYKEGDELFITGKDTSIYFPREEHSLIKYDGRSKHFATAVPAGEGRYVMNRLTGEIRMVKGPAMLLPDPREEVIIRRALSDTQVTNWYPGNAEALEYNRILRSIQVNAPTTRQGAISEGDFERGTRRPLKKSLMADTGLTKSLSVSAPSVATYSLASMDSSLVHGDQQHVGDEFSRASTYTQPRTVTLNTKFEGVPSIDVWTGYAVMVVSKTGKRRVVRGPTTLLLEYDESLEVVEISTGKPKNTDHLLRTVFLRTSNNKISDRISVETLDHVNIDLALSYLVQFEGEESKWFEVENYVKFLCDHVRSILKGAIKKSKVEDFYVNNVDIIRNLILGKEGERHGLPFPENGTRITDVDILGIYIKDEKIRQLLDEAQHAVVQSNISLSNARRDLSVTQEREVINQQLSQAKTATKLAQHLLDSQIVTSELTLFLEETASHLRQLAENKKVEEGQQEIKDIGFNRDLDRSRRAADQQHFKNEQDQALKLRTLDAETAAMLARFQAGQSGFSEALLALGNQETLIKVAEAMSVQTFIGGKSFTDVVNQVFNGTSLQKMIGQLTEPKKPK